jgi:hypothetical protein
MRDESSKRAVIDVVWPDFRLIGVGIPCSVEYRNTEGAAVFGE